MSDYHHARKMEKNGCPKCGGADCDDRKYRFECDNCGLKFP